jgi:hypothetical protein
MKEEDLNKAIGLKKTLDDKRELLQIANSHYVDLRVNLEERYNNEIRNVDYLLDNDVIKGLRAMVIANIERRINDLQEELEKL